MIGGTVVDVWRWEKNHVSVVVQESHFLCVLLEKNDNSLSISRGDSLWWQSDKALWTSQDKSMYLVGIKRIGYSFSVPEGKCPERIKHAQGNM